LKAANARVATLEAAVRERDKRLAATQAELQAAQVQSSSAALCYSCSSGGTAIGSNFLSSVKLQLQDTSNLAVR